MGRSTRHQQIIDFVNQQGFVTIDHLANHFNVTPQTIRRDINILDNDNQLCRYHGGAAPATSSLNPAYTDRKIQNLDEKQRIAKAVAQNIPDGCSLFISIGTTTEAIAQSLIGHSNLTIVTNNLHVASILSGQDNIKVIIAGGVVRSKDGGIIGETVVEFVNQFKVDYAIFGIAGIDEQGDLLDFDYQELRVAQAMVKNSRNIFLVADHFKFGRTAMFKLGNLKDVTHLVTDKTPPTNIVQLMQTHNIKLLLAQ